MNWRVKYQDKIVSADKAVECIKSGDLVVPHHAFAQSDLLVNAMTARSRELENVHISNGLSTRPCPFVEPGMEKSFWNDSLFCGPTNRSAIAEGRGDFMPVHFSEMPRYFQEDKKPDVLMLQLSLPDEQGNCSFGISADYSVGAAKAAKTIIAHINPHMPRTSGASISLDDIDWIVEKPAPVPELSVPATGKVEQAIAGHITPLISDGDTLQLGIGTLPDAVLSLLKGKRDLGIHTEVLSDGVIDLFNQGIITNNKKTLYPGKFVATCLLGTKKLYDFVDNNPDVLILPVEYVNDPFVISQNNQLISINSALQIDLMGQVNAEMVGSLQFSGIGGQGDYIRGASRSPGGKSIIALPSTASKGKISRIACRLDPGSAVTTSRYDVHYVATEYGIVNLRGKSLRERAKALISIAHPDFREALLDEARALKLLY